MCVEMWSVMTSRDVFFIVIFCCSFLFFLVSHWVLPARSLGERLVKEESTIKSVSLLRFALLSELLACAETVWLAPRVADVAQGTGCAEMTVGLC